MITLFFYTVLVVYKYSYLSKKYNRNNKIKYQYINRKIAKIIFLAIKII